MTALGLVLTAALLSAVSGIPALFGRIHPGPGRKIACLLQGCGAVAGLAGAGKLLLLAGPVETVETVFQLPISTLLFRLDPLSAFFLIPVLIVGFCVTLYACGYYATSPDNPAEGILTFYLGLAVAAIIMLLLSANGVTLLLFLELMALLVYLAMSLEHGSQEVRQAGIQYLVASHTATLLMMVLFALITQYGKQTLPAEGSLDPGSPTATAIFFVALAAFGMKAGIMPLHIWLPTAHANAPSHVSALMSGIVIKTGIYGLLRVITFFSVPPLWWGILLLCLGIISAVTGVLFAIGQHDIKRLLAYHSIENIGIIVMGIGVALIGLTTGNQTLFVLGMAGALLHVLNHALFKSLLFLGAGAVIHVSGTRDIDRMGGVSRALPLTSLAFLIGAVAICGLPPLNGFVSELLIYLGIFQGFGSTASGTAAFMALAAPLLALTGGLALACFVKVYGSVFLGAARNQLSPPHESPAMTSAMTILSGLCILIGVIPWATARFLETAISSLHPQQGTVRLPSIQSAAPLFDLSISATLLASLIVLLSVWYVRRLRKQPLTASGTWDCGYAAPSPTMQYTASSFAEMLVDIFKGILRPDRHPPEIKGLFPGESSFESHVPEVVLEKGILPFFAFSDRYLAAIRRLQNGQLNHYILYIFVALITLLALSDFL